jgi:choline dehydrogenase
MKMSRRDVMAGPTAAMTASAGYGPTVGSQPRTSGAKQTFDILIIGGGSAGAVLAARLSTDVQPRVLLLEAGQNFTPDSYSPVLTDANIVAGSPTFDWQYHTAEDRPGRAILGPDRS